MQSVRRSGVAYYNVEALSRSIRKIMEYQKRLPVICHFTSVHMWNDVRIFLKECRSLASAGYKVYLVAKDVEDQVVDGVYVVGVPHVGDSRLKRVINQSRLVYKKALDLDADIYHFHDSELLRFGLKLQRIGKKVIYDAHEDLPGQLKGRRWIPFFMRGLVASVAGWHEKRVARQLSGVIAATPHIREVFRVHNSNVLDINNYPIESEFPEVAPSSRSINRICYIGAITRIRGILELVAAMEHVRGRLIIAGGFGEHDLRARLERMPGWKNVEYRGVLDRGEIARLLSQCAIGVVTLLPNSNYVHSQPIKLYEYMLSGMAVLASDFPDWKRIVEERFTGVCVNPRDSRAIAKALNEMIRNEEETMQMGRNGRSLVLNEFMWGAEEKKLTGFYSGIWSRE